MSRHGARKAELERATRDTVWRIHAEDPKVEVVHACVGDGVLHLAVFGDSSGWSWSVCVVDVTLDCGQAPSAADAVASAALAAAEVEGRRAA